MRSELQLRKLKQTFTNAALLSCKGSRNLRYTFIAAACAGLMLGSTAHAAYLPTVGGYQSFADSPLAGVGFSSFALENFEDGLNTAGVTASAGTLLNFGTLRDSVDADDGLIDGSGLTGFSWYSNGATVLEFSFSGPLPTHAGIVWTDVGCQFSQPGCPPLQPTAGNAEVQFEAFDQNGVSLGAAIALFLGDNQAAGGSGEDTFFGATNAAGISKIRISMADSDDWEVDHLQFGIEGGFGPAEVPEPSAWLLTLAGLGVFGAALRRRQR